MNELNIINELIRQLKSLQPLKPEVQNILDKKFRLEFNYNTNHIEGNTITYSETELLLIFDDTKGDHSFRELEEMKGSDVAFKLIKDLAYDQERPLTEQNIKYLNEILLVRPFYKDAITEQGETTRKLIKIGEYKEMPNSVMLQNGEIFHYSSPLETPAQMAGLISWLREEEEKKEMSPVVLAAMLHYKFVCIHPFDDGNGRISRLLVNYILYKNNLPPVIIKSEDKKNYLSALHRADTGDLDSFVKYIAKQLIWSLEISIKAAKGLSIDEPGDLDKKIKMLKQKLNAGEEAVIVTKSKEVIMKVFVENIEQLFIELTEKLSQFDSLFRSKQVWLSCNGAAFASTLEGSIAAFKTKTATAPLSNLKFHYILKHFRKGQDKHSFSCSLEFEFHPNAYDMSSENIELNFSKLYHQKIEEEEKFQIIEQLGTYIYEKIEEVV